MILTKRQQSLFRGNGSGVGTLSARETADAVISALTPAAWYRNATDVVSSGGFASIWADYASSVQGLMLPGSTGNYASATDAAVVGFPTNTNLEYIVRLMLPKWTTPAGYNGIMGKGAAGSLSANWFFNNIDTTMYYRSTADGSTNRDAVSSAATGITDGDTAWLRVTHNVTTGKVNFYKAADSTTVPTSWTQIGTEQTVTAGDIYNSANVLELGSCNTGTTVGQPGSVLLRAIVYSGFSDAGGTKVFDADFSSQAIGTASFTESSSNAATVTINTSGATPAHIGKARDLLQGTGTNQPAYANGIFTFDGADNFMSNAYAMNQPVTVYLVFNPVGWTAADVVFGNVTDQSVLVWARGVTPRLDLYAGTIDVCQNTGFAVGSYAIMAMVLNGASSILRCNDNADATGNPGAQTFLGGFRLAAGGVGLWSNIAVKECVLFEASHDDTTRDSVVTALNDLFTVF